MKDLLKDVVVYVCKLLGCPENIQSEILLGIALLFILIIVLSYLWKGIMLLIKWRNKLLLNKNLKPYFTSSDVKKYTKHYITQYYQDISPSNEEEPNPRHIGAARQKIIKLFINEVFKEKSLNKYFIILAGAGMGKTAFMINLYLKHINQFNTFFSRQKLNIKLFPLGAKDILEKIKSVPNKNNTILLLDALDEDTKVLKNYDERMSTILDVCNEFNIVVITCRTQFFSNEQEEPYETGQYSFGESGHYYFRKVYLSPFNHLDIKKYINKKFKFYQLNKKRNARKIIVKSQSLLVRPMLLSHIEDLIKIKKKRLTTFYIYEVLINKWLDRESKKPGIDIKFGSTEKYKELLKNFSIGLSKKMYDDIHEKGLLIHHSSNFDVNGFDISILESEFLNNKYSYIKSKSLLNRDSAGNYKFSHKSIFEYFFTLNIIQNPKSIYDINFNSLEVTELFLKEFFKSTNAPPEEFINYYMFDSKLGTKYIDIKYFVKIRHKKIFLVKNDYKKTINNLLNLERNYDCIIVYDGSIRILYSLVLLYEKLGEDLLLKISKNLDKNILLSTTPQVGLLKKRLINYIKNSYISNALSGLDFIGIRHVDKKLNDDKIIPQLLELQELIIFIKKMQKEHPEITFYY
ncbi:hypothetical protein C8N46_102356 [Kordia periserrulae]|uniref:NACHT domain-containing protein n=1 Tax=Kordia periserrulae TaxID=701523 RepID=A0A2T6C3T6_9FLAO|nr:hypothetical protein [Kordia periserrulae]PTX62955.1 hypothetical protein C8N46_102356 [Kordia periserrulae]